MLDFDTPREVAGRGYESAMPVLEKWMGSLGAGANEERQPLTGDPDHVAHVSDEKGS